MFKVLTACCTMNRKKFLPHNYLKFSTIMSEGIKKSVQLENGSIIKHVKHKVPQKRASKLLGELRIEELNILKNNREWPEIKAGDSIQVERLPYMSATETNIIKGVVIARTRKCSDSSILVANVEFGTPIVRRIMLYNPLIKDIKILQRAFIHKGLKRVRRSKIYYLLERDPQFYTVK